MHAALAPAVDLDLASMLKAAQAITGEIVLERLLARLIQVIMESAGAQHALLLLEQAGDLAVAAAGILDEDVGGLSGRIFTAATTGGQPALAAAVITYVARTRELVVLHRRVPAPLAARDAAAQPEQACGHPLPGAPPRGRGVHPAAR